MGSSATARTPSPRNVHRPDALPALDPTLFKSAFRHHAGGVALITADAGSGPAALTASSVFSVSVNPNLIVFSVSDTSSSSPTLTTAETVVIHMLSADEINLATLGATSGIDRFADREQWSRLPSGEPHFAQAKTWIRARVIQRLQTGTATVVVVEALEIELNDDADGRRPLIYHDRTWHTLSETTQLAR